MSSANHIDNHTKEGEIEGIKNCEIILDDEMGNELVNYIKLRLWKIIVSKIILISGSNGQESDF